MKKIAMITLVFSGVLFAQSVQDIINANGCLGCHAVASKKLAPAFAGIAKRNKRMNGSAAKVTVMNSIKNGSHGKYPMFSNSSMPPFPNISKKDLSILADYILAQSSKAQCCAGKGQGMGMGRGMR